MEVEYDVTTHPGAEEPAEEVYVETQEFAVSQPVAYVAEEGPRQP